MKHYRKKLLDALTHLDPTADSRIKLLSVLLSNGATIVTRDVTVESDCMIYARDARVLDRIHYFHAEDVVAVSVELDPSVMASEKTPTFPELLCDAAKR